MYAWLDAAEAWLALTEDYRTRGEPLFEGLRCFYCDRQAQTFDHVVPRSAGGRDEAANLVPSCRACNASKSYRSLPVWLQGLERFAVNAEIAARRAERVRLLIAYFGISE